MSRGLVAETVARSCRAQKGEVALEALWLTLSGPETSSGLTDVHVSCIFALHGTARDSFNMPNQRSLR